MGDATMRDRLLDAIAWYTPHVVWTMTPRAITRWWASRYVRVRIDRLYR